MSHLRYGYILVKDRWHRVALQWDGDVLSQERCNLDDAKVKSAVQSDEPTDGRRCMHCWDEDAVPEERIQ